MSDEAPRTTQSDGWFRRLLRGPGIGPQGNPESPMQDQREVQLPSATDDIAFRVSLDIFWASHSDRQDRDDAAIAVEGLVERAKPLSQPVSPLDSDGLQRQLSAGLADPKEVGQSGIWSFAHVLGVVVLEDDLEEARKQRALHRARLRAETEREIELADIAYLRDNVFADLGQAVLWWLRREDYAIDRLQDTFPHLDHIVRTVRGATPEDSPSDVLLRAVRALFKDDDSQQFDVIDSLRRRLIEVGRDDAAKELVERGASQIKALGARMPDEHGQLPPRANDAVNGYAAQSAQSARSVQPADSIGAEAAATEPAGTEPAGTEPAGTEPAESDPRLDT